MGSNNPEAVKQPQLPEPACEYHEKIRIVKEAIEAGKVTEVCVNKSLVQDDRL